MDSGCPHGLLQVKAFGAVSSVRLYLGCARESQHTIEHSGLSDVCYAVRLEDYTKHGGECPHLILVCVSLKNTLVTDAVCPFWIER